MKIEPSKEWCERSAEIEGDAEVGAGVFPASTCSPPRGYETSVQGSTLTMRFESKEDASAFFDWIMENTIHKANAKDEASTGTD